MLNLSLHAATRDYVNSCKKMSHTFILKKNMHIQNMVKSKRYLGKCNIIYIITVGTVCLGPKHRAGTPRTKTLSGLNKGENQKVLWLEEKTVFLKTQQSKALQWGGLHCRVIKFSGKKSELRSGLRLTTVEPPTSFWMINAHCFFPSNLSVLSVLFSPFYAAIKGFFRCWCIGGCLHLGPKQNCFTTLLLMFDLICKCINYRPEKW